MQFPLKQGYMEKPLGLLVERDLYFKLGPFSEVIAQYRAERGKT
jgi:hypothetical protein